MSTKDEAMTVSPNGQQTDVIRSKWLTLSDDEKNILGRPNFACGQIAERMRKMGIDCDRKAEAEQALVILTMLEFHKSEGEAWAEKMNEWLKAG